ncbi:hypothetical protein ACFV80_19585 [Streptomyces sp. NPDC059862]|uniref:hypothetical protein n=1 Tax=Streptomyces sp. NPDC059862 TaxID=3346975 RepID=UPI003646B8E0
MTRTSRTQRLVMLAASTGLAAGGALLPTSAFAAPATPHTGTTTMIAAGHDGHSEPEGDTLIGRGGGTSVFPDHSEPEGDTLIGRGGGTSVFPDHGEPEGDTLMLWSDTSIFPR